MDFMYTLLRCLVLAFAFLLSACSSTGNNQADPYEGFNRSMYSFNKGLDTYLLKPMATGYDTVTPNFVQDRVGNFMDNFAEVPTLANSLFQVKFKSFFVTAGRLLVNTTFGVGGLFDPATPMGMERRDEDLGQTLAFWGVPQGPYLMVPFFGPSTLRDIWAEPGDGVYSMYNRIDHVPTRNTIYGFKMLDTRTALLPYDDILTESLDEYAFVRDAYLQRRNFLIHDGNPPLPALEDDCDPADDDCF